MRPVPFVYIAHNEFRHSLGEKNRALTRAARLVLLQSPAIVIAV